ncbi:uncharacterized protein K460DRAFT_289806 [Cucurbitaria berberidis CBS 394.84]|uniref:Uncharacterized protein n=1 Tax=Cucurbitaria berberidis CBS 394.84 TaxID=1168544 RepID=A0A9P4L7D0_9PLEO|nr:uncharacterized protein K460DRAFT_289806 [Cucurbitaria berberidis CBS 394.84]KAF1844189.1 hypothetical protein K460DRAFT_289806 [Cucurbitaria berberidis CBS 394.84]
MQFKNLALIAAALSTAAAEFVIITDVPTPTRLSDLTNLKSYISSLQNFVTSKVAAESIGPSAISAAASAHLALVSFAATASYSIPSDVTKVGGLQTFTTVPDWYSALPSNVKSYYDANNARVQSIVNEAVGATPTSGASGNPTGSGSQAKSTAAAPSSVVKVVGAGVAAAFVGVMAL